MRRPGERPPTVNVGVRVEPSIRATLEHLAHAAGMTLAAYAAEVLTQQAQQHERQEHPISNAHYPSSYN